MCSDKRGFTVLDISSGVCNDSSSGEETTANTNEMPKIKHTQVIDKELTTDSSSSESEDEDPTYFPRRSPQNEEFDSDTSEEFPFYQRASSPHPSHQVSGEVPALQPNVLECSSSSDASSSSSYVAQHGSPHGEVTDSGHSSDGQKVTSSTDAQGVPYAKPYRLCIFCNSFKSKLSQHIATQHSDVDRVTKAMKLPKAQRVKVFDSFRKEGILKINKQQAKALKPSYHRERACENKGPLVMCNICCGIYSKHYMKRHSNVCLGKSESSPAVVPVPMDLLSHDQDFNTHFANDILCRFRKDAVGKLCINDSWLTKIGKRLWEKQRSKINKKTEVRKSVMTDMRRLAALYLGMQKAEEELGELPAKEGNVSDLFKRTNFPHLEISISNYTSSEISEPNSVKAGLKLSLYSLLKSAAKIVKGTYLIEDKDELSNNQRQIKLRKPEALPQEDDVRCWRDYTVQRMECITYDQLEFWDLHRYVELRDLVVCRLTLFNARRGGEPSRLLVSEWKDAENNVWIDKQQLEALDDIDKALAGNFKVAYQSGKGSKHLVPVLFPKDTIEPVRKLCDEDIRSAAAIASTNIFLFPTTNGSENHVSGWHAVSNVCEKVDLTNKETLTATKNCHRLSTLFAIIDVPESERQYTYKHMGHSEETNQHIYQAPLAVKELTVVGKCLQTINEGCAPSCSGTSAESCAASLVVTDGCVTEDETGEGTPEETGDEGLESGIFKHGTPEETGDEGLESGVFKRGMFSLFLA
ncbi:hypothetical protein HOLleu_43996 [Holothuria leucospilota]|uniref:SET domain-containing protein n=1 Tax=Holothuria leucospilota TaxID=206669 RepID=A0A9Q0Y956_HOLLE|nr:hypothetical protein HOLleu_43996 [Holothuria leucospilota]